MTENKKNGEKYKSVEEIMKVWIKLQMCGGKYKDVKKITKVWNKVAGVGHRI